jgi:hypothetical protein
MLMKEPDHAAPRQLSCLSAVGIGTVVLTEPVRGARVGVQSGASSGGLSSPPNEFGA